MKTIILDVAIPARDIKSFVHKTRKKYNIHVKVLNNHGPGGGWPEIKFSGNISNLYAFAKTSGYVDNIIEFKELIEK